MKRIAIDTDNLVSEYLAGKSEYALANELGVSRPVLRRRLIECGIQPRGCKEAGLLNWRKMTNEQRAAQVIAAHDANRGRIPTEEELCRSALGRQRGLVSVSAKETAFAELLRARHVPFVQQLAVGPYNCDFAIPPVAVEIFGGGWHWHGAHLERTPRRLRYLFDRGWSVLIVTDYGRVPIETATADYVASYVESARREPPPVCEYRVIRGAGEVIASGCANDHELSIVPAFRLARNALGRYESVPR